MSVKSLLDTVFEQFEQGNKAIDMSYNIDSGKVTVEAFSVHDIYKWDDKPEPVFFNYNSESKRMNVNNLTASDLMDESIMKFLGIPSEETV